MNVSGGTTDRYLVTGLHIGAEYTISIVATSQHLSSDPVVTSASLSEGIMTHIHAIGQMSHFALGTLLYWVSQHIDIIRLHYHSSTLPMYFNYYI